MRYDDRTKNKITALAAGLTVDDTATVAIDGSNFSHVQFFVLATTGSGERAGFKVQESDNGSSGWTDITGAVTVVNANLSNVLRTILVDHHKYKRYLRGVFDQVLGTPTLHAVYCIQQNEKNGNGTPPDVSY
jgi:hypothetical protein